MFRIFPYTLVTVVLYNVLVFVTNIQMQDIIFAVGLPSGNDWAVTVGDGLLAFALGLLFIELISATSTRASSVINHGLSTVVFTLCIIEFLLVYPCGTSTFFLLTMISLVDVVAGYSITIMTARRDLAVGDHFGR